MTSNPLRRRADYEPAEPRYTPKSPQEDADMRNAAMLVRNPQRAHEIEWCVGAGDSVYLRDKPSWTAARTREIERERERQRAIWKANHRRNG